MASIGRQSRYTRTTLAHARCVRPPGAHPRTARCARATACAAVLLAWLLLPAGPAAADGVTVTPWGPPDTETFDHNDPPGDLPEGENGDAAPDVQWSATAYGGTWNPGTSTLTITSAGDFTLSGHTNIRLPDNADATLTGHENGHDRLSKDEYDRLAKKKVEDALKGFVGMSFVGTGATDADRLQSAKDQATAERDKRMKRAIDAIKQQMDVLNDKYDDLTEHGSSPTVDTPTGETKAKEEQAKAPPAGSAPVEPDPSKQESESHGMRMDFDEPTQKLVCGGFGIIDVTRTPFDPIYNRGRIALDSLIHVGTQLNGTIRLSDTRLQIIDMQNGDTLMNAYLLEPAYMPSHAPGYTAMIQGYLDVPPAWAGGVRNTINSPFLSGMQAASDAGWPTTAWIYTQAPLFDANGEPVIPPSGVPVTVVLGVGPAAVPAMPPWGVVGGLLLALGVAELLRRRKEAPARA
ncbi:MAG: hypothetical protein A2W00_07345 [Candidatus Eisenbacteria bacterium RBG_16_71_46]|nr:MAG: hypothetical protein A2W00_07345 [Candidatus Eisenbacteria bacterium RBG_16_71_46]